MEADEEMGPDTDLPTPFRSPSYRRMRQGSGNSGGGRSSGTEASGAVPGVVQVSLAPHSITQRDGGVLGIQLIDRAILMTATRRAFDVPYDSNWIVGKSPDPLVQAAYDFWGASHALIPQKVCVEGALLYEDLVKQDETFERPIEAVQGDLWGFRSGGSYLATSFSDASSSLNIRLDRALRSKYKRRRSSSFCEASLPPVESPKKEASFVDNDLLMYKIRLWDDKQVEPEFQDTWDTLPGDRAYKLKKEALGLRALGQSGRPRAVTVDGTTITP